MFPGSIGIAFHQRDPAIGFFGPPSSIWPIARKRPPPPLRCVRGRCRPLGRSLVFDRAGAIFMGANTDRHDDQWLKPLI
jgi:hypothetical protein